jgi:phosphotriesterase-related protein
MTLTSAPTTDPDLDLAIPDQSGRAMTVLGPIEPGRLGETLMHEHLFIRFWLPLDEPERWERLRWPRPETPEEIAIWDMPFSVPDRAMLLGHFFRNRDSFTLDSVEDAIGEVAAYLRLGGRTIVDVTSTGLDPQPERLRAVAAATGVNIVMGTGFYRSPWHPADMDERSIDDLTGFMVREIVEGAQGTGIRAGIVGEIPADDLGFHPHETNVVRVLRAAARASRLTGAALSLHSDFEEPQHLHASLDIVEEEGADLERVIVGHISTPEVTQDTGLLISLAERGASLQFDVLGAPWELKYPADRMIAGIENLVGRGYSRQVLVSHDVCTKLQRVTSGGHGLTYVHNVVIPELRKRGVTDRAIHDILVDNPRRVLTFVAPAPGPI